MIFAGTDFAAFAQHREEKQTPLIKNYVVPAAKKK